MIVQVHEEDFAYARETCPDDAPMWMLQEFAANSALRREFPEAETIKVFHARTEIDGQRYHRSLQLYLRRRPYRFLLGRSKLVVRLFDLRCLLTGR